MQERDGSMRLLNEDEAVLLFDPAQQMKVLREGMYFKIKHTYFQIIEISPSGIQAKGVSRREYFDNRK